MDDPDHLLKSVAEDALIEVDVSWVAATVVLRVSGELDLATRHDVELAIDAALAARPVSLHLDLGAVRFIDSCGVEQLLTTRARLRDLGVELSVSTSPRVERVLDLLGLRDAFTLA